MDAQRQKLVGLLGRSPWLSGATIIVWMLAISLSLVRYRLAAQSPVTLVIATTPETIRLTINGEKYADGAYIETPINVPVSPGKTRVKIYRDGYVPHLVSVEGESGDVFRMEGVFLQKNPDMDFTRLAIQSSASEKGLFAEIDDGFARGELPLVVNDLSPTKPHSLTLYPNWPDKSGSQRCRIPSRQLAKVEEPLVIKVRQNKKRRINFQGCQVDKGSRS